MRACVCVSFRYLVRQSINVVVAATISAAVAVDMVVAMLSLKFRYSYSVVDCACEHLPYISAWKFVYSRTISNNTH